MDEENLHKRLLIIKCSEKLLKEAKKIKSETFREAK